MHVMYTNNTTQLPGFEFPNQVKCSKLTSFFVMDKAHWSNFFFAVNLISHFFNLYYIIL